ACSNSIFEVFVDAVGHQKLGILGPAVESLGETDLVVAEWFAMSFRSVLLVRSAIADMAVQDDQRRAASLLLEEPKRVLDSFGIVRVADSQNAPAIGQKTHCHIFGECNAGASFDRDVVVVVDPAKVVEP